MFLDRIVATKHKEVELLKESFVLADAERAVSELPACRGFARAVSERRSRSMGLIAEVKKASPSKGLIRPDFHPAAIAKSYESAGADCISVLTDVEYFHGSNEYLKQVRAAVDVPLLRKDFTIDYRQVYEARLIGADAVLLIAAILTAAQMRELLNTARSIGLDALIEVHDRAELEQVLELGADVDLIGINNRNLRTFETSLATTAELAGLIPDSATIVSESGISKAEDIPMLLSYGAQAVLVGEHFMRHEDVESSVHALMGPAGAGQAG